jgi:hypothetical protein
MVFMTWNKEAVKKWSCYKSNISEYKLDDYYACNDEYDYSSCDIIIIMLINIIHILLLSSSTIISILINNNNHIIIIIIAIIIIII